MASSTPQAHERIYQEGARVLSDQELLTVLLGPSAGANSTSEAAARLLREHSLHDLAWASPDQLLLTQGIGPARAAAITAAFELGRRGASTTPKRGDHILDPGRVFELLRHIGHADREQFWVVLLDVRGRLIRPVRISEGALTQCPVPPRDVLREAIRVGAHGLILVHNHPSSGDPRPSAEDFDLTQRLRAVCDLVGIVARDHVIIGTADYYSFVGAGRWKA
jgi:DNA repair protein RadC